MDSSASLQRWQQAFEDHPISTTRILEKQLRAGVANNRERLRGLVGGNYRELLSTADQIVSLDLKTRTAEARISELGQLCGPPPRPAPRTDDAFSRTAAALFFQQRCIDATRLSINKAEHLRAAQLLIVSRLLLKSLNDEQHTPPSVPALQEKTAVLRRQVLFRIDNVLSSPRSTSKAIVQAASAYCLISSASSADAFEYVQRLRLEKLRKTSETSPADFAVGMLGYILSTSQVLKRAFARALTDVLTNIQRRPVLMDLNLVATGVIGSVEFLTLVPEDVRSFSPYFKREPVSATDLAASLGRWTSEACDILRKALREQLQRIEDIPKVLVLRRQLYETLLPLYFTSTSSKEIHLVIQEGLLQRIEALISARADQLTKIAADFISSQAGRQELHLWRSEVATMQVADGGSTLLRQIKKRRHGTHNELVTVSRSLARWTSSVRQILDAFEQVKSIRWRDLLEEPDDEQDDEAEVIMQALLSDAPAAYTTYAGSSLRAAITGFEAQVVKEAEQCTKESNGPGTRAAVHYIRVIRLALQPLRNALAREAVLSELESAVPKLHQYIAEQTTAQILTSLDDNRLAALQDSVTIEHVPSPVAFTLLQEICSIMSSIGGSDIWSGPAVRRLKSCLREKILIGDSPFARNDFDRAYLGYALASEDVELSSQISNEVAKGAQEYWARTKLLFGPLTT